MVDTPNGTTPRRLFEIVSAGGEMDEVAFHDAVSLNLKRGRLLLLIVGDGIREGLEIMTEFLQRHAGLHFTLSVVELALFEIPGTGFIAQPRVLAKTTNIERGIVTLRDSRIEVMPPSVAVSSLPPRSTTITQEHFFEDLERNSPGISEKLRRFLADLAEYNVLPDYGSRTLTLRWHLEDSKDWNLATIVNTGDVWMEYHAGQAKNANRLDASKDYLDTLATLVPGASVKPTKSGTSWNLVDRDGHAVRLDAFLADDSRKDGWIRAIAKFQAAVANSSEA